MARGRVVPLATETMPLVLQLVELFVDVGDLVEDRDDARPQLRLHRRQRDRAFLALGVFTLGFGALGYDFFFLALGLFLAGGGFDGRHQHHRRRVGLIGDYRRGVGCVEVDDVAQQHLAFAERVAPQHQRAHGQRAFADAADHHLAPGLDALGDGDLALARQQLDRAHLAQVHAHRVVGAADIVVVEIAAGLGLAVLGLGRGGLLGVLVLDDVDAELGEHRHRVLDLLGRHLLGRQRGVQFVIGEVAALLAAQHHLLDGDRDLVEQRRLGRIFPGFSRVSYACYLACHSVVPRQWLGSEPGRGRNSRR